MMQFQTYKKDILKFDKKTWNDCSFRLIKKIFSSSIRKNHSVSYKKRYFKFDKKTWNHSVSDL